MNRPWVIALAFGGAITVLFAVMFWTNRTVLDLDRTMREVEARAAREESAQLALGHLDAALSPLLAEENARPYFSYSAFFPAERVYMGLGVQCSTEGLVLPSAILRVPDPMIHLHFQLSPQGILTSPQVPLNRQRAIALKTGYTNEKEVLAYAAKLEELRGVLVHAELVQGLPPARAKTENPVRFAVNDMMDENTNITFPYANSNYRGSIGNVANDMQQQQRGQLDFRKRKANVDNSAAVGKIINQNSVYNTTLNSIPAQPLPLDVSLEQSARVQMRSSKDTPNVNTLSQSLPSKKTEVDKARHKANEEFGQTAQMPKGDEYRKDRAAGEPQGIHRVKSGPQPSARFAQVSPKAGQVPNAEAGALGRQPPDVGEGQLQPLWLRGHLLLARRVAIGNEEFVQGCWMDWQALRQWLEHEVSDRVPHAKFEPCAVTESQELARRLAALPVKMELGPLELAPPEVFSPLQLSLTVAWVFAILASVAVGGLLRGAVSLSERRATFVSAVTHELRTPLTTFRLYTDLLASERVQNDDKRRHYVHTLQAEAARLCHLVENVLAFSRLERGRADSRVEVFSIAEVLQRAVDRLEQRASQANLILTIECRSSEAEARVRADALAVEQILFNLVDNASKYATSASDRRLHLEAMPARDGVCLRVRDHGPGINRAQMRGLFRPFSKSAQAAAHSAPGVGLGLALSRRLARRLGGDLVLDRRVRDGAAFLLTLPQWRG